MLRNRAILPLICCIAPVVIRAAPPDQPTPPNWKVDRLVAWCIVPFDARHRSPAERADMIQRLGMRRVAYDWRQQHIVEFEEEIQQYQRRDIEFFAFWSWHESMESLIRKYQIRPQVWQMVAQPKAATQDARVEEAAASLLPLVRKTAALGCPLGIYNHGGWSGEPANMVAVCARLRMKYQANHVGIVYNMHHGHDHMSNFAATLAAMQPYLLCLNLNGMADAESVANGQQKILPLGSGKHERTLIRTLLQSGYRGPIGILDHRPNLDAEDSLRENLNGIRQILTELGFQVSLQHRSSRPLVLAS